MSAIYKRELKSYFRSFIGFLFIAVTLFFLGLYFSVYNLMNGYPYFAYVVSSVTFLFMLTVPILTMRILAEEKRSKTDQLILTAPVSVGGIVMGKFLALLTIFAIPVAIICFYPLIMVQYGSVPMGEAYLSILAYFLFGMTAIAIGLFLSSVTESQVIAAVLTFLVLFLGYMMDSICSIISSTGNLLTKILRCFDLYTPFSNLLNGTLDVSSIVYYASVTALVLFLTVQSIQKRRYSMSVKNLSFSAYSTGMIAVAVALVVVVNIIMGEMPSSWTAIDMTSQKLYSLTDQTVDYVKNMQDDVTIYVLVNQDNQDTTLGQTLQRYDDLSDHITSALDYVLNDDMPKVYMTTGHNELSLSNTFTSALNKENVDYETVNLMDLDTIPDDAACLFINGATSDFSSDDKDKVIDYLNNGGKVILVTGYTDEETPNIDAILSYMNLSIAKGLVVENDSNGYYRSPYYILPTQSSDSYTSGTYGKYLFLPYSQGIIVPEEVSTDETATGDITYDIFLSTSDSSFAKQDVNNTQDFSQGENDVNGPFALGVEAVKTLDDGDATLVVYGCEQLFTDDANSVVSGANLTLFTNTFSGMTDHETSVSIPVKSYEVSNLVVDSAQILLLGLLVTVILPVGCMIAGFVIWFRRRKR